MVTLEQIKTLINGVIQKIPKLVNPDWNEKNPNNPAFIKNKPNFNAYLSAYEKKLPKEIKNVYCIDLGDYVTSYGNPNHVYNYSLEVGTRFSYKLHDDLQKMWLEGTFPVFKGNMYTSGHDHNYMYNYLRSIGILLQVDPSGSFISNDSITYCPSPIGGISILLCNYRVHITFEYEGYDNDNYRDLMAGVVDRIEPVILPEDDIADQDSVLFRGERDVRWGKLSASDVGAIPVPQEPCEAGQFLQVSAVDTEGNPIAWKVVDLPTTEKKYELIEKITLEEDTQEIVRNFKLKKMYYIVDKPALGKADFLVSVETDVGGTTYSKTMNDGTGYRYQASAVLDSGIFRTRNLGESYMGESLMLTAKSITSLKIAAKNDSLPAGLIIEIYGIK